MKEDKELYTEIERGDTWSHEYKRMNLRISDFGLSKHIERHFGENYYW